MQRIILILLLAALGWYGWGKYDAHVRAERAAETASKAAANRGLPATSSRGDPGPSFITCDGRNTCLQMTSCEEAKFFVRNCPGMNPQGTRETASCIQERCR